MRKTWVIILSSLAALFLLSEADALGLGKLGANFGRLGSQGKKAGIVFSGSGDIAPSAIVWAGLRAYSKATAGTKTANICNSGDANCADVNTLANGNFDVATAHAAPLNCGGAGGTCTIKTLYDKIGTNCGGACDLTNATAANRPTLVFNDTTGGSRACMRFNGSTQFLATTGNLVAFAQPFTVSTYAISNTVSTQTQLIASTGTADQWTILHPNAANLWGLYAGASAPNVTANDSAWHSASAIFDDFGGGSVFNIDGTANAVSLGSSGASSGTHIVVLGAGPSGTGGFWTGDICEIGVWTSHFTPTTQAAMFTNQDNYYRLGLQAGGAAPFDPSNPASSGFASVFADEFNSLSTIDVNNTLAPGFNWYVTKFFGFGTSPASAFSVSSGVLTIAPTAGDTSTWQMATAAPSGGSFVGTAPIAGGKATYIEAALAFDDQGGAAPQSGLAFWSIALQHGLGFTQWPGQTAGYDHYGEFDFYEYSSNTQLNNSLHDWYGIKGVTCSPSDYCNVSNTNNNAVTVGAQNFTTFHRFGALYMPGPVGGYVQYYYDGVPTNAYSFWLSNANAGSPPPVAGTTHSAFSILDTWPNFVILGTGVGLTLKVDYVRIWQKSDAANDDGPFARAA